MEGLVYTTYIWHRKKIIIKGKKITQKKYKNIQKKKKKNVGKWLK